MEHIGLVLGIEMCRITRNNSSFVAPWHRQGQGAPVSEHISVVTVICSDTEELMTPRSSRYGSGC
jgi:hypothetical protein